MHTRRQFVPILAALAVAGSFLTVLLLSRGSPPSLGGRSYNLRLIVPSAVSVVPGSGVRIAGLEAGRVSSVELAGRHAVISLAIDDDQAPLPKDTTFAIRLRTLIGETFVALYPGTSPAELPDRAVLPASSQTDQYVEVEQILDVLKGSTRERARSMIQSLGRGLEGRGPALNDFAGSTAGVFDRLAPLMDVLHEDRAEVARLVDNFGAVARSLADRGAAIHVLAREARVSFEAVASRDDALRATIDALPSALSQVRETSNVLQRVTGQAAPVLHDLARLVDELRPAVDRLEPAARQGSSVLRELHAAAPVVSRTLTHAEALSAPSARALPLLHSALCQLNPTIRYLKPYAPEIAATFQNLASGTNYYDANGHAARVLALVGENSFAGLSEQQSDALKLVLDSGLISKTHTLGYNPYPRPGDVGPPTEGLGQTGPRDFTGRAPRVPADC
jgi:phospholipid/cholesterol/gamma-HCH transport system substrate-binding protein